MNWSEVLAGENITAPAEAILSSTFNDTAEEAAPTMTWVPAASSRSTVALAVSVVVSPESPVVSFTGLPNTPPLALISLTASFTPAAIGGPRKARLPVSGSSVPMLRGSVLTGPGAATTACVGSQDSAALSESEPELQPASAIAAAAATATAPFRAKRKDINSLLVS